MTIMGGLYLVMGMLSLCSCSLRVDNRCNVIVIVWYQWWTFVEKSRLQVFIIQDTVGIHSHLLQGGFAAKNDVLKDKRPWNINDFIWHNSVWCIIICLNLNGFLLSCSVSCRLFKARHQGALFLHLLIDYTCV